MGNYLQIMEIDCMIRKYLDICSLDGTKDEITVELDWLVTMNCIHSFHTEKKDWKRLNKFVEKTDFKMSLKDILCEFSKTGMINRTMAEILVEEWFRIKFMKRILALEDCIDPKRYEKAINGLKDSMIDTKDIITGFFIWDGEKAKFVPDPRGTFKIIHFK